MFRGVGGVKVSWRMSGISVGGWGLKKGVERVGGKGCCMVCGVPWLTKRFLFCPWALCAIVRGSVMCVGVDPGGCQIVREVVHREGG